MLPGFLLQGIPMFVVCTSMPKPGTFSCLKVLKNRPTDPGLGWDAELTSVAEDLRQMVKIPCSPSLDGGGPSDHHQSPDRGGFFQYLIPKYSAHSIGALEEKG